MGEWTRLTEPAVSLGLEIKTHGLPSIRTGVQLRAFLLLVPNFPAKETRVAALWTLLGPMTDLPTHEAPVLTTVRALPSPMSELSANHATVTISAFEVHPPRRTGTRAIPAPGATGATAPGWCHQGKGLTLSPGGKTSKWLHGTI